MAGVGGPGSEGPASERGCTVFVRNLPYDASDADLTEAFADAVGPVRRGWVVRDPSDRDRNRGFGYVTFALPEDAGAAVGAAVKVKGRQAQAQKARPKAEGGGAAAGAAPGPPVAPAAGAGGRARVPSGFASGRALKPDGWEHRSACTVALGGLAEPGGAGGVDPRAALKEARRVNKGKALGELHPCPAETVAAARLASDGCTGGAALVAYATLKEARRAVRKLHGSTSLPGGALWARQLGGEGARVKSWRVIVRNVSWKATEADVRDALSPAGYVWEVKQPRKPDGKSRGFAFVAFTRRQDALKAVTELGLCHVSGRPVAVDWALGKDKFQEYERVKAEKGAEVASEALAPPEAPPDSDLDDDDDDDDDDWDEDDEGDELAPAVLKVEGGTPVDMMLPPDFDLSFLDDIDLPDDVSGTAAAVPSGSGEGGPALEGAAALEARYRGGKIHDFGELDTSQDPEGHRSGYAAIIGRPNAGKSTLMNTMVGQKVSIVTHKPNTTRHRVLGIVSEDDYQLVLLDTPGVIRKEKSQLDRVMMQHVRFALLNSDVIFVIVDASEDPMTDLEEMFPRDMRDVGLPVCVLLNKADLLAPSDVNSLLKEALEEPGVDKVMPICALDGRGVDDVQQWASAQLPAGPSLYPKDVVSEHPERFFVAEIVREKVFLNYRKEVPYAVQVRCTEYKAREDKGRKDFVQVTVYVERDTQKAILLGHKGAAIRKVGAQARRDIEDFVGKPVFLELAVKVTPAWRQSKDAVNRLGLSSATQM